MSPSTLFIAAALTAAGLSTAVAATAASDSTPIGLVEYLIGQGVFGALTVLFIYMWRQSVTDFRKFQVATQERFEAMQKAHAEEVRTLQEKRLDESKVAAEKRLDMQGKLIETMNAVTTAVMGLQESFKNLREWLKK